MTIREVQAILLLYNACADETTRRRALTLVPDLVDIVDTSTFGSCARRRRLEAFSRGSGLQQSLGRRFVVCRNVDLEEHKRDFAMTFDLALGVVVTAEDA